MLETEPWEREEEEDTPEYSDPTTFLLSLGDVRRRVSRRESSIHSWEDSERQGFERIGKGTYNSGHVGPFLDVGRGSLPLQLAKPILRESSVIRIGMKKSSLHMFDISKTTQEEFDRTTRHVTSPMKEFRAEEKRPSTQAGAQPFNHRGRFGANQAPVDRNVLMRSPKSPQVFPREFQALSSHIIAPLPKAKENCLFNTIKHGDAGNTRPKVSVRPLSPAKPQKRRPVLMTQLSHTRIGTEGDEQVPTNAPRARADRGSSHLASLPAFKSESSSNHLYAFKRGLSIVKKRMNQKPPMPKHLK